MTVLLSHTDDGAAGATWPRRNVDVESCWQRCCRVMLAIESCWRQRCRDDLVMARYRGQAILVTVLSSHAGDGAARVTWPRCNVDVKSYWK
jgi:hypothetical protein